MKTRTRLFIRTAAFLLVLFLLIQLISSILMEKWKAFNTIAETYITDQYNHLEHNSVELAVLGSSQTVAGFSGIHLLEQFGIRSFSPSTSNQPMICTCYYAKQMMKTQQLKAAVIDVSMLYEKVFPTGFRRVADTAPFSIDKLKLILNHSSYLIKKSGWKKNMRTIWSYFFPFMQYHDRWESLTKTDFGQTECGPFVFCGNTSQIARQSVTDIILEDKPDSAADELPDENQLYWFREMIDAFQQAGIPVLLIKTPKYDWTPARYRGVCALAEEYGLEYLDFNTRALFDDAGLNAEQDFSNPEHLNYSGAIKLTDYLAEYLCRRVSFNKCVLTAEDEQDLADFHAILRKNELMLTDDAVTVLSCAADGDCTLLLQIDEGAALPEAIRKKLEPFGFHADQAGIEHQDFFGLYTGNTLVYERYGAKKYSSALPSGLKLELKRETDKNLPVLYLNETAVSFPEPGVHIVISADRYPNIIRAGTLSADENGMLSFTPSSGLTFSAD
ncbi:MAG: hypothetical protein IJI10_11095 [Eubacterium sp.]|nr:hypothetical protein [Eubacterium sp.]